MGRLLNKEYSPEIYLVCSVQEEYNLREALPVARVKTLVVINFRNSTDTMGSLFKYSDPYKLSLE